MALYVHETNRDESEEGTREEESGTENRRVVWLGSWVLGNSRRPPNELFSSLPIYFCSLFNQPLLATLRPPSFLISASSFQRNIESPLSSMQQRRNPSSSGDPRPAWINGRREKHEKDVYVVNIRNKMSNIFAIYLAIKIIICEILTHNY